MDKTLSEEDTLKLLDSLGMLLESRMCLKFGAFRRLSLSTQRDIILHLYVYGSDFIEDELVLEWLDVNKTALDYLVDRLYEQTQLR